MRTFSRPNVGYRRKICRFCVDKIPVDYKDVRTICGFVTEKGKIIPRRISGACAQHQRELAVAIKRARQLALLPFAASVAA
ncbi:MAG: 30S ribosomal protein S18 [Deltaproteobacteria bacterium]|nr:30S ribosomal protein S18 [Deltaproteobacteria bacterium]